MVSWDMEVRFFGFSPHIKELEKLAKWERFSNIEDMKFLRLEGDNAVYWLAVNDGGMRQTEFKSEKVK